MSQFDAMMMTLWLMSLVIAGAAGMTALLRLTLAVHSLFRRMAERAILVNWARAGHLVIVHQPVGAMRLEPIACD